MYYTGRRRRNSRQTPESGMHGGAGRWPDAEQSGELDGSDRNEHIVLWPLRLKSAILSGPNYQVLKVTLFSKFLNQSCLMFRSWKVAFSIPMFNSVASVRRSVYLLHVSVTRTPVFIQWRNGFADRMPNPAHNVDKADVPCVRQWF